MCSQAPLGKRQYNILVVTRAGGSSEGRASPRESLERSRNGQEGKSGGYGITLVQL